MEFGISTFGEIVPDNVAGAAVNASRRVGELIAEARLADEIGLDAARFAHDIRQQQLADKVEADFESGLRSGVNRTPTFFINGEKFNGDWSDGGLLEALKQRLLYQEVY